MVDDARTYRRILKCHLDDAALVSQLAEYAALLDRWSARHNLVSYASPDELVTRHLLDAVAGRHLVAARSGRLIDVGSGAGLPGVPLLLTATGWSAVLIEPRHKRAVFLRTVIRELALNAEVAHCRFEEYDGPPANLVTARALGGYDRLLKWSRARLAAAGRVALWVTVPVAERVQRIDAWRVVSSPIPGLDRGRLLELEPCFT